MSLSQEPTSAAGTGLTASEDVPLSTLVELRDVMRVFVSERGWEKFHTPRNLLVSRPRPRKTRHETPDPDSTWTPTKTAGARGRGGRARRDLPVGGRAGAWPPDIFSRENVRRALHLCARARRRPRILLTPRLPHRSQHLGEELADVLLFLVRMSDVCGVDLAAAAAQKMRKNRTNYPRERCFGSAAKHSAYRAEGGAGAGGGGSAGSGNGGAGGGGNGGGRSWALEVPVVLLGLAAPLTIVGAWAVISALRLTRPA